uniref:Uncharacterized protein n=1 Tax=Anguilla anguilla TaxID=7936 RepID=A0A0E9PJV4_ANGAN
MVTTNNKLNRVSPFGNLL